jgi:hypothetical protein
MTIGLVSSGYAFMEHWKHYKAKTWERVSAIVTKSYVEKSKGLKTYYIPHIVYEYTRDGLKYTGDNLVFGEAKGSSSYRKVKSFIERHPAGSEIIVYVDPGQPNQSALDRDHIGGQYIYSYLLGALFIGLSILLLLADENGMLRIEFGKFRNKGGY